MNVLSMYALIGAYKEEGQQWVDELCQVLKGNAEFACTYIQEHFEGVEVSKPQGKMCIRDRFEAVAGLDVRKNFFDPVNSLVEGSITEDDWIKGVKEASDQMRENLK